MSTSLFSILLAGKFPINMHPTTLDRTNYLCEAVGGIADAIISGPADNVENLHEICIL